MPSINCDVAAVFFTSSTVRATPGFAATTVGFVAAAVGAMVGGTAVASTVGSGGSGVACGAVLHAGTKTSVTMKDKTKSERAEKICEIILNFFAP